MRLIELIASASDWTDDDTAIYVTRPWRGDADAILVSPAPDTTEPVERDGTHYDYFLETFIARDVLEGLDGSADDWCQRLIDYAENDA
jgi:isopenicillin N synthase-like dioxygenase